MTPQEYFQSQKAKLVACYNIEKSIDVAKVVEAKQEDPQVIDVELVTDQERLSQIKEQSFVEKAFDVINKSLEVFEKGGEGSRGGKVVGYTKSGKPIYSNGYHTDYSSKNYSSDDHKEISDYHKKVSQKSKAHYGKETTHSKEHDEFADAHEQFSKEKAGK